MEIHHISPDFIGMNTLISLHSERKKLALSDEAIQRIEKCRAYLDHKTASTEKPIYGVNTGFGSLCDHSISTEELSQLQKNLVLSHACGMGARVPHEMVKWMLFLKIQSLSYGHSGVQLQTVQRLIDFYNNDVFPVVYTQGSLGASGDLSPLAHLSLPILGAGKVVFEGKEISGKELNQKMGWEEITLKSKEGLALLNGTQFMSAYGVVSLLESKKLLELADIITSISLDAFDGRIEPFEVFSHAIRPHNGQLHTAEKIFELLEDSEGIRQEKVHVQDPYSFRCVPQVHGASKDALSHIEKVVITEINSVTDNPNVFADEDRVISAGNFHGQPLALSFDFLSLAMAEIGSISERRIYKLISGERGLPAYLVAKPGLNSGLMIPQYTAASIVSQSKQLATPASVDSIVSSNGQEDHVSMGANAATKMWEIVKNTKSVLAIELLNASQAMSFRTYKTGTLGESLLKAYRADIPFIDEDVLSHDYMQKSLNFIDQLRFDFE
ncbi:MAG: histidine ammonia-lyase [Flavobacteriales bacterium]|jgi:histidine ammonia-lyase|nr:histidine ammonia-lyase [Flavobacteriales bacterium]